MRWWRVTFDGSGRVGSVEPIDGEPNADWVVVEAPDAEAASRRALNIYCARKKRERIKQLHASGHCHCSRKQDRPGMLTCSVCAERRKKDHEKRQSHGFTRPRDEAARVEAYRARSRDRRAEIRLETLLEVRAWWQQSAHTLDFAERLAKEILAAGGTGTVALPSYRSELRDGRPHPANDSARKRSTSA